MFLIMLLEHMYGVTTCRMDGQGELAEPQLRQHQQMNGTHVTGIFKLRGAHRITTCRMEGQGELE